MIQLSGGEKRFGHKLLFENIDWLITREDRVGLVTTLSRDHRQKPRGCPVKSLMIESI